MASLRYINLLNTELNPIHHLLALLGDHPILHVSRVRVKDRVSPNSSIFWWFYLHEEVINSWVLYNTTVQFMG